MKQLNNGPFEVPNEKSIASARKDAMKETVQLFFNNSNTVKVLSKVPALLLILPYEVLSPIDVNKPTAIQKCIVFLSQLNSTLFIDSDDHSVRKWKKLNAQLLQKNFGSKYKKIIEVLQYEFESGPIIQVNDQYTPGVKSKRFCFNDKYIDKGIVNYQLTKKSAITCLNNIAFNSLTSYYDNSIVRNLLKVYPKITLPTEEQIKEEAKRIIKSGGKLKNGKRLYFLNNKSREFYKNTPRYDYKNLCFVEDSIEKFNYFTQNGYRIPTVSNSSAGNRVYDSFNLMPSFIRNLILIDKQKTQEVDIVCLHPNLINTIYDGTDSFLTHQKIVDHIVSVNPEMINDTSLLSYIKKEHLSFFNMKIWQMKKSILWDYYFTNQKEMLDRIIADKRSSEFKHKITSMKLFDLEVRIMNSIIEKLNLQNIYCIYVFDALLTTEANVDIVRQVINETLQQYDVATTSTISIAK